MAALLSSACGGASPSVTGSKMVHVQEGSLVDGQGRSVRWRGIALSRAGSTAGSSEPSEADYQRIADMGFGSVRLDFELWASTGDAEANALSWLDQQLGWAKSHHLLVVLALSRPSASTPSKCVSDPLWVELEIQEQLAASWQQIARRYADEPSVAGYDLLHEPAPSDDLEQWRTLATRLVTAIREVDREHLLIFEQAQLVACKAVNVQPEQSLTVLDDSNVLYGFEARGPSHFTTQSSSRSAIADGGSYPDELEIGTVDWQRMTFEASDFAVSPVLSPDETDWIQKKHYYSAVKPSISIAQINLRSANNPGTVYFDDLKVEELGPSFDFVRTVVDADLEDATSWFLWQDPRGNATGVKGVSKDGHRGKASVTLTGTTSDANLNNDSPFIFPVKQNHTYRVTGWMKGEHSASTAVSMIGLSLWSYDGDIPLRDSANLAATVQPFVDWGQAHRVPVFVSAFGTSVATFLGHKGGMAWVSDTLNVLDRDQLSFCYDVYRGEDFGIYGDRDRVNQPLVDLFTERLPHAAAAVR
jgi:endoglucanase